MKYAAPELVRSDVFHQNQTTDTYAVGILLYQLLCGHLPFEGSMQEVMEMQLQADIPLDEIGNPVLRSIIKKATEKLQEDRYQSASEFRVALDACSVVPKPPKPVSNPFPIPVSVITLVGIALVGIALGVAIAFLL